MATQNQTDPITVSVESATERISKLNEKAVENRRKASAAYVNSYERAVLTAADSYEKAAAATHVDWISTLGSLQADVTREVTKAYAGAARDFVA
jgi:hypothetical protein